MLIAIFIGLLIAWGGCSVMAITKVEIARWLGAAFVFGILAAITLLEIQSGIKL